MPDSGKCICISILFIVSICILSGCSSSNDYPAFRERTVKCIEDDGDKLVELFGLYHNGTINYITLNDSGNTDNCIAVEFNSKKYYVNISQEKKADPKDKSLLRACEIFDYFKENFNVTGINYYTNREHMEIWFDEGYLDIDWGIKYYPPNVTPEKDIKDKEQSEEIKDGFYTYIWFKG